ncbi:MAG: lipoate--protein ligase [Oscillospiraceae bacterium]|jgi:lipoate-protein ligase A
MIYMETGSHDPTWNLAFEEYCLTQLTDCPEIMLLWQNHHSIIIGRYQNAESEVNANAVRELGVNVVRRSTGGGAVYHDLGNLNYSFIFPESGEDLDIERICRPMIRALREMGIPAELQGRNDLAIQGQKISGTAQRLEKGRMLHHGTLLFDSDLQMLQKVLRVDHAKFQSKGASSVRSRVTNIKPFLPETVSLSDFWQQLLDVFGREGLEKRSLGEDDLARIRQLRDEKYRTWDWNYGQAPAFQYCNTQRYPGGKIQILFNITHGLIHSCKIQGDFLGLTAMEGLESLLVGLPFQRSAVEQRIKCLQLHLYLGKITLPQLLDCMFQGAVETERCMV